MQLFYIAGETLCIGFLVFTELAFRLMKLSFSLSPNAKIELFLIISPLPAANFKYRLPVNTRRIYKNKKLNSYAWYFSLHFFDAYIDIYNIITELRLVYIDILFLYLLVIFHACAFHTAAWDHYNTYIHFSHYIIIFIRWWKAFDIFSFYFITFIRRALPLIFMNIFTHFIFIDWFSSLDVSLFYRISVNYWKHKAPHGKAKWLFHGISPLASDNWPAPGENIH